jgi:hypothetical protein
MGEVGSFADETQDDMYCRSSAGGGGGAEGGCKVGGKSMYIITCVEETGIGTCSLIWVYVQANCSGSANLSNLALQSPGCIQQTATCVAFLLAV